MIADQVEEGVVADEVVGAPDGVAVAAAFVLFDEAEPSAGIFGEFGVGAGIAGVDHDTDLFDSATFAPVNPGGVTPTIVTG